MSINDQAIHRDQAKYDPRKLGSFTEPTQAMQRPQSPVEAELSRVRAALADAEKLLADFHERLRPVLLQSNKEDAKPSPPESACSDHEGDLRNLSARLRDVVTRLEAMHSSLRL